MREQVYEVSDNMWAGFPKVIARIFPNAVVVFDRFHVMMLVNKPLSHQIRKSRISDAVFNEYRGTLR